MILRMGKLHRFEKVDSWRRNRRMFRIISVDIKWSEDDGMLWRFFKTHKLEIAKTRIVSRPKDRSILLTGEL